VQSTWGTIPMKGDSPSLAARERLALATETHGPTEMRLDTAGSHHGDKPRLYAIRLPANRVR
jgi:hypothetical protein